MIKVPRFHSVIAFDPKSLGIMIGRQVSDCSNRKVNVIFMRTRITRQVRLKFDGRHPNCI